jgi:adenosylhomocysteine nucleosidase
MDSRFRGNDEVGQGCRSEATVTQPESRLGILAGLKSEAATLASLQPAPLILLSGARPDLAREAAGRLAASGCTHLLSYGLAGGLDPALTPGTLLLPEIVLGPELLPVDPAWHARALERFKDLTPITAPLAGVEEAIASPKAKQDLRARTGAASVDMESQHLGRAAQAAALPFLVLRVVADTAAHGLPPAALVGVRPDGGTDIGAVLRALLRRPGQLPALLRLGSAAGAANRTLLRCAHLGVAIGTFP